MKPIRAQLEASLEHIAREKEAADLQVRPQDDSLTTRAEWTVEDLLEHIHKVHDVMKRAMQKDHHYGVIPGTPKPTLLKPGAELLCLLFRLDPQYAVTRTRDREYLDVLSTCTLYHIPSGQRFGSGMGSCSTREQKYAYRAAKRVCPTCGKDTIIKGKAEFGGGWTCWKKKNGCGAKFTDLDPAIINQPSGRTANEDLADQENTVLKMANKRSLIAAVLNVTAASDIFTQELSDLDEDWPTTPIASPPPMVVPAATTMQPVTIVNWTTEDEKVPAGAVGLVVLSTGEEIPIAKFPVLADAQEACELKVPVFVDIRFTKKKTPYLAAIRRLQAPSAEELDAPPDSMPF